MAGIYYPPYPANTGIAFFDSILQTFRSFAAINRYNDPTPFTRTAPFFQLWFVCLLIAIVSDTFIKPAAKVAVSAFAASLLPEAGQVACNVTQHYGWRANLRTTTSGSFHGRPTTVLVFQQPRISFLKVEMACRTSWVLDIRKRNLASEALAWAGAPLETGDEALDKAVVIQGDDEPAIRQWVRQAEVQPRILSLFQVCGITFLMTATGSEGEPLLRAHYRRFRPRFFPLAHAVGILDDLAALAASAEAASA
jgi:hypothetical protein